MYNYNVEEGNVKKSNVKKKDNRSLTVLLKVIITIVAFIIGYGGYLLFEKLNVKMVDES